jgi:hypothetical protein
MLAFIRFESVFYGTILNYSLDLFDIFTGILRQTQENCNNLCTKLLLGMSCTYYRRYILFLGKSDILQA